ncbi:TetR-like C-terminal domain-containing protein [Companilactobacillus ginsenosidimutans]|uniref:TetR family transcriptional regulator n=1 Tax=Companilactobacillus ginsenosidimutans TaxID=1007676 RepID=A0A0H4QJ91_9LACO|nr:TetR-like C-terminal domain-containing protein [Companilactobacillus ginsenosidimutans]AKP67987.1 TetR family transcriptional regulator [Companilactobacillus ginsenosidimutans]
MTKDTKKLLAESLLTLLCSKPIDHITIKDIVTECDVTRQTFYNHFSDIYELVEWISKRAADRALVSSSDYDSWQQGFYNIMVDLKQHETIVHNIYESRYRDVLEDYFYRVVFKYVAKVVELQAEGMNVEDKYKHFIAHFYTLAFIALIFEWAHKGMKEDPQTLIDQTSVLVEGDFKKALQKYDNQD